MKETFGIPSEGLDSNKSSELKQSRGEIMEAKQDYLAEVKDTVKELFGTEKIPKELLTEMIDLRQIVAGAVDSQEFSDSIDNIDDAIKLLTLKIAHYKDGVDGFKGIEEDEETGEEQLVYADGRVEELPEIDTELLESLRLYYDTYRMARNGFRFKENVKGIEQSIVDENKARKLNFYSKNEKNEEVLERLQERYSNAGFTEQEFKDLVEICDLPELAAIDIQHLKVFAKVKNIFERYMHGDKSKYVALSAALMLPAFIDGYSPMLLADAFEGSSIDMTQVGLYALLTSAASGVSGLLDKYFSDFLQKNFKKEGGPAQEIAENLAEFPAQEINNFGMEAVKRRVANGKESYEDVLRTISFDVLPAMVTLTTSAVMLYQKNPLLAAGTVGGTGIMMALDKYLEKKGKFWEKKRKAENRAEASQRQMEEQLNAHMEIILSGLKDEFADRMEDLFAKERTAFADKDLLRTIENKFHEFFGSLNLVVAALTTFLAGGSPDKFVAALVYSGGFKQGVSKLLRVKRSLLGSFRDMQQMELMFNGYAAEEAEKEKDRIGVDQIEHNDISLNGVNVEFGKAKILDNIDLHIPAGAMVNLSGASGAGKTTLMKVLAGYYRPTTGEVTYGGVDMDKIKKSGKDSIYSRISYLPQFPYILDGSIKENLKFGIDSNIPDQEIKGLLAEVGLSDRFKNLDENLKGGRGDMGTASGGESSRIGLARVLLKIRNSDSRIVFLDEPTASVDQKTKHDIAKLLNDEKQARPDVTFIVISHDTEFVQLLESTMEVHMDKGKLAETKELS